MRWIDLSPRMSILQGIHKINKGVIVVKVISMGHPVEKACVTVRSFNTSPRKMRTFNPKGVGLHTAEGVSNKEGLFAVPFLWDGKYIAEALNNAHYTLQVSGMRLG